MLKKWLKEYIQINKREILIVIGLLLLGVIIGIGAYVFATEGIKQEGIASVKQVLDISKEDTYVKINIIKNGIRTNLIIISLIAISSVMLWGKYVIYGLTILKGASISLYTIVIFNVFGMLWGIVVTFLLLILVNILYIPSFIYLVLNFLEVNFNIFNVKLKMSSRIAYKLLLAVVVVSVVMFSSVIVEQVVSTVVLKIYSKI